MEVKLTLRRPRILHWTLDAETCQDLCYVLMEREWMGRSTPDIRHKSADSGGIVRRVELINKPTIDLPRWTGYSSAPRERKRVWDQTYRMLHDHEFGHHRDCEAMLAGFTRT